MLPSSALFTVNSLPLKGYSLCPFFFKLAVDKKVLETKWKLNNFLSILFIGNLSIPIFFKKSGRNFCCLKYKTLKHNFYSWCQRWWQDSNPLPWDDVESVLQLYCYLCIKYMIPFAVPKLVARLKPSTFSWCGKCSTAVLPPLHQIISFLLPISLTMKWSSGWCGKCSTTVLPPLPEI